MIAAAAERMAFRGRPRGANERVLVVGIAIGRKLGELDDAEALTALDRLGVDVADPGLVLIALDDLAGRVS